MNTQQIVKAIEAKDSRIAYLEQKLKEAENRASWHIDQVSLAVDVTPNLESGWREFSNSGYGLVKFTFKDTNGYDREVGPLLFVTGETLKKTIIRLDQLNLDSCEMFDELKAQLYGEDGEGGILIPEEFTEEIMQLLKNKEVAYELER